MLQGKQNLVGNALAMAGGQLGNKSPNLQSPPNVSVAKGNVDSLSLGNLPSSLPNSASLQSMANNGSTPQVMSSIQGNFPESAFLYWISKLILNNKMHIESVKMKNIFCNFRRISVNLIVLVANFKVYYHWI